ncbi:molecular chaperone [Acinetobacter sp. AL9]|uniref:fimbrial biogenesis chaperone n=1 Tax=Acinetobacter sp. AL9 TaxID=3273234 RepID=UPI003557223E
MFRYAFILTLLACMVSTQSWANIVMVGTRVIFPAESNEKTLQFSNNGDIPYIVQIWLDRGNDASTPENADAPFVVNPPFFRINPHQGQMARLIYVPQTELPKDRESIFYLNFKQIPALQESSADQNKLIFLVKNRLKVFYRPKSIIGNVEVMPKQWTFKLQQNAKGSSVIVNNPTGYYANLTTATLKVKQQSHNIDPKSVAMIAPYSSATWPIPEKITVNQDSVLSVTYVNDYGAIARQDIPVQQP